MNRRQVTRGAIYLRISLDDGTDYAALGIDRQREASQHLAQAKGWSLAPGWEVVDQGVSASNQKQRPGFQRLLQGMRSGHIDGVIAYAVDRLARRLEDLQELIAVAEEHGVPVTTVSGDLDLSNASGQGLAKMLGVIAEMETKRMGERMRARKLQNARNGSLAAGGRRPYGFTANRRKTVPEEAAVIREVAKMIIDGASISSVTKVLNRRGVPTAYDTGWTVPRLRATLKRPTLAGRVTYKGELMLDNAGLPVRGEWDPILTDDEFEDLQVALSAGEREAHPLIKAGNRRHLLSGISRCGLCGQSMIGFHATSGRWSYVCRLERHVARSKHAVDQYVIDQVRARAADTVFSVGSWSDEETQKVRGEIERLEARKRSASLEFADGSLPADMLRTIAADLQQRINQLRSSEVGNMMAAHEELQFVRLDFDNIAAMSIDEQRNAVAMFVERIVIHKSGRGKRFDPSLIEIQWKPLLNPELTLGIVEAS